MWYKKWSNWASGVGQEYPTPTPSAVRNPTPTPYDFDSAALRVGHTEMLNLGKIPEMSGKGLEIYFQIASAPCIKVMELMWLLLTQSF